ncbi:MAG: ABC transporter permease [Clostridiales bacterium]|nr:ABC transporter permease [Clostridiales bacterium]
MFLRILKKELKKKKAMNLIVLLFITLAAMFVGCGLNNVITVMNGTSYYLEKAGVGDFVIITRGPNSLGALDEMLATEPSITDYRLDTVIYGSQDSLRKGDGSKIETRNVLLMQDYSASTFHFFDKNNETPAALEPGHCYVTGSFLKSNDMKVGDILEITQNDVSTRLIIDGKVKDALLGSDFMGNTRILMHSDDFNKFASIDEIKEEYSGQVCCIDTNDVDAVQEASANCSSNISFAKPSSIISLCYVMDMIVAFVVLILSVCLIILSFVVLKVSLSFTISKEYREIGVMKAIGIKNNKIRSLYLTKYLGLAILGSFIGFFLSIPLNKLLLSSVTENMVLGNSFGLLINAIGALIVVITIVLLAYMATRIVKKATPVDAIRTGQSGERYNKKSKLHLSRSKRSASAFLAVNDTVSSPKRYISIIIAFTLCMLFVLMLVNTTNTMQSEKLINLFATKSDLYIDSVSESMKVMAMTDENKAAYFDGMEAKLTELGIPGHVSQEQQYTYTVEINGKVNRIVCEYGYRTRFEDTAITEGTLPQNKNEVAIGTILSDKLDLKIGDSIMIDFGTEKLNCIITGRYQSFNQVGEVIRLHPDAPVSKNYMSSLMGFQIDFNDNPSAKVIEERKDIIKANFIHDKVENAAEYVASCINVVPTMIAVQYLLLAITILIVILVTILMEVSFISDEKSQIALLKAIGFKNGKIYRWHVLRFGIVTLFAMLLSAALSIPMTKLCITPIFGMMGANNIKYAIDPLQIFLIYPAIIIVTTLIVAFFTSLSSKSIKSSDTANIE